MQKFGLQPVEKKIAQAIKLGMRQGSIMSRKFFIESFTNQGFTDKHLVKWQPRKGGTTLSEHRELKSFWGKKIADEATKGSGRAILIKSGALRRSILVKEVSGVGFKVVSDMGLGGSQDYAPVHNYGLRSGRGRGFKMPQRQFMGESAVLVKKITDKITSNIENAFK